MPLLCVFSISHSELAFADWFLSKDTKALIEKAEAGDAEAQFRVGSAYDTGNGAPRNGEKALKYYLMAAEQGNAEAQNSVGSGLQAQKRYSDALNWYQRAADQGHALAINNLAYLYDLGLGVKQDREKAFELYSKAADLGWAEAMFNLANMYGAGQIGEIDYVKTFVWCDRAERYATTDSEVYKRSEDCLQYLNGQLSLQQIESAKVEAQKWKPNNKPQPTQ